MSTTAAARPVAIPAFTGLRFVAAFHVVLFHFAQSELTGLLRRLVSTGPLAVSLFFLLSGCVLTYSGTDDGGCSVSPPRRFIAARLARLYPLYILALALDAPFVVAHLAKLHSGSGELFVAVLGVIPAALLVQSWWPGTAMGWNSPGWSLSCEAFFYVLWPAAAPRLRVSARASWWIAGLVWCVALAAPLMLLTLRAKQLVPSGSMSSVLGAMTVDQGLAAIVRYHPLLRVPEFILGILLGHALRRAPAAAPSSIFAATSLECFALAMLGLAVMLLSRPDAASLWLDSAICAPLFALLAWELARGRGLLARALSTHVLVELGEASYALYILQEPVGSFATAVLKRLGTPSHVQAIGAVAVVTIVAVTLHRSFEPRARSWVMSWLTRRERALAPS